MKSWNRLRHASAPLRRSGRLAEALFQGRLNENSAPKVCHGGTIVPPGSAR